ncbi:uncharacterized protein [Amphiura filiformis]|uniref:uncharacterized protein n=1 Tax=Amphiura filiformis TaxID=82378 RepID=UPI003B2191AB
MATSRDLDEFHFYIQCHEAIQIVCDQAVLPCAENVIRDWHATKQIFLHSFNRQVTLQPCLHPTHCPARITDNKRRRQPHHCPVHPPPCQNCIQWCHAIESLFWSNGYPSWRNINPSKLFTDYVELAKAFAVSLPPGQSPTCLRDFDPASILKIMTKFGECHLNNPANHDVIQKVYQVRNNLCHKRIQDNLQVSLSTRNEFFDDIFNLVDLLENIHPTYFSTTQADDVRDHLQNIQTLPVTPEMEQRATRPLTAEMKQWMQQIVKDSEDELKEFMQKERKVLQDTMTDCTEAQTITLQDIITGQTNQQTITLQDQARQQTDKLTSHIDKASTSTEQTAKQRHEELQEDISHTEESAKKRHQELTSELEQLPERLIDKQEKITDVHLQGRIQKWRQQLKGHYLRNKREIRFGRRSIDIASMDELFVDLTYFEEQGNTTSEITSNVDSDSDLDTFFSCKDLEDTKRRKLESYKELFTLPDKHHILLYGEAGTGKTTHMSRIAYDWAKNEGYALSVRELLKFELVLVLDIRKFQSNQTLAEAIKRQLLPGATTDDIDQVLDCLRNKCLVLLDGFDEMPKGLKNHALSSPHLDYLFVMVTTRPHLRDHFCRRHKGYNLVQVSGFSKENVLIYIEKFFQKSNPNLAQKVQEIPLLQTMSSFPVLLVMICLLWEDSHEQDISFHSMTSLYKEAVSKYLNKPFDDKDGGLSKLEIQNVLLKVGEIALTELFANHMQIEEELFGNSDVVQTAIEIGLLVRAEGKLVDDSSVSFIHKTFQEFCAALYLSDLDSANQEEVLLRQLNKKNVDEMEHLLRFICGLNLQAARVIFPLVIQLKKSLSGSWMSDMRWELPALLLFEVDLSHSTNVEDRHHLHRQMQSSKLCCEKVKLNTAELLHYFGKNSDQFARDTWLNQIKIIDIQCEFSSIQTMLQGVGSMSLLEHAKVRIRKFEWMTPDIDVPPCQSLSELRLHTLDSDLVECNVISLASLLSFMPKLTKVSLNCIQLTGGLVIKPLILSQSLKEFHMSSSLLWRKEMCIVYVMPLVSLLSCMPALTKVSLDSIQLTSRLDGNPVILSQSLEFESVTEFDMRACTVHVMPLVRLLSCMPALPEVSLKGIKLTGELDCNPVILSQKKFEMSSSSSSSKHSVDVMPLVSLLSCMNAVTTVTLKDIELTGGLNGKRVILSKSLKEFDMSSSSSSCDCAVMPLVSLLSCMPKLLAVCISGIVLTGALDDNPVNLSKTLTTFYMSCHGLCGIYRIDVMSLVGLVRCMPGLTTVSLENAVITDLWNCNLEISSRKLKRFNIRSCTVSQDTLEYLRAYTPAQTKVSFVDCEDSDSRSCVIWHVQSSDSDVQGSDSDVQGSDSDVQGSDSDVQGSDSDVQDSFKQLPITMFFKPL